jgi:hypothetical protein
MSPATLQRLRVSDATEGKMFKAMIRRWQATCRPLPKAEADRLSLCPSEPTELAEPDRRREDLPPISLDVGNYA